MPGALPMVSLCWESSLSYSRDQGSTEQTGGFENQDPDDDQQGHRELKFGTDDVGAGDILQDADNEAAERGTPGIVDSAQQRAGEAVQQNAAHHVGVEVNDRRR